MVPYAHGEWLAAHIPTAIPHLFDEHGHLSLAVDSMGLILDELVARRASINRAAARAPWAARDSTSYRPTMLPADPSEIDLEIEEYVIDALERLPQPFAAQLGSVAIVIEEEPTQAQLASVGARGLFGLYQGVPRTRLSADAAPVPSKITLFRGPLVRASRDRAALADRVADTVYHEVAHHFGISDARLHELKGGAH